MMQNEGDELLDAAARALRRSTEAPAEAPLAARRKLVAALAQRKARDHHRRTLYAAAAATLLAVTAGSTAWATATGRLSLPALWHRVQGASHTAAHATAAELPAPRGNAVDHTPQGMPALRPTPPGESVAEPAPATATAAPAPAAAPAPLATATPTVAPAASAHAVDTDALFREAHEAHFVRHDPAAALRAWDRYLRAAPRGRFAVEARYNRALDLIRLGRRDEAAAALRPFADGALGGYRRDEAARLLDAMARHPAR